MLNIIAVLLLFFSVQLSQATPTGIVSFWKFDQTSGQSVPDLITNTSGAITGTPIWSTGVSANALKLNGSSYVTVNNLMTYAFMNTSSFTVSVWVRDDQNTASATWSNVFSKGNGRAGYCFGSESGIVIGHAQINRFVFALKDDSGLCKIISPNPITFNNPLFPNYHLLTLSVDRVSQTMNAFVDDILVGSLSIADLTTMNNMKQPIYFGGGNNKWLGMIDELKIYNIALKYDEIRTNYYTTNAAAGGTGVPTIALLTPIDNSQYVRDQQIKFTANATTTASVGQILSYVQYYANGALIGESNVAPYTFIWERMPAAVYSVYAKVIDFQGSTAQTAPITVRVNDLVFSNEINPTKDPIGGGVGYTKILSASQANYVVSNATQLLSALSSATSGQIIYVDDNAKIDLTGKITNTGVSGGIVIPSGVTLASGRGANGSKGGLIFSNDFFPESQFIALFAPQSYVRITGLRLQGPSPLAMDEGFTATGVANAIRLNFDKVEIDNCELYAWDKWAVWIQAGNLHKVHHNYFHDTMRNGYGYGIWVYSSGSGMMSNVEANLFDHCRHCIASSGHENSWQGQYNIFLERNLFTNNDRHGQGSNGINPGGKNTTINNNLYFDTINNNWGIAAPVPTNGGLLSVYHNWLFIQNGLVNSPADPYTGGNAQITVYDNRYNFNPALLPTPVINASVTSGTAPLTVNFTSAGSSDPDGYGIDRYQWTFGDGDYYGSVSNVANPTYTFTTPGRYMVRLMVGNSKGVVNYTDKEIIVNPAATTSGKWLSLWVMDSYIGNLTGFYQKQVLVNNTVVWSGDVAGNQGWEHVLVNIAPIVTGQTIANIQVRLASINATTSPSTQICEMRMWVDDVYLSGETIKNPGFEAATMAGWTAGFSPSSSWSTALRPEAQRSGTKSFCFRSGLNYARPANQWVEIFQAVTLVNPVIANPTPQ